MSKSKSFIAKIEEKILKSTKLKFMDSQKEVDDFLAERSKVPDKGFTGIFKSFDFNGMKVFSYGNEKKAKNTILYVHGGAFVNEINIQHHLFCRKLSRKLDAYVLAPVYPLAPLHKSHETYEQITGLYEMLIGKDNLTLMGDSAGGGFVLSFAQYLKTVDLAQPSHIVAISPWVDISMSNPPYDSENDCILGEIGLKEIGKSWAGDLDTKDWRVSPLFGDNTSLADTLVIAGDGEIFYRDIERYVENLKKDNVNVRFITGNGMFHIYPLFPSKEAKEAFKEIKMAIC